MFSSHLLYAYVVYCCRRRPNWMLKRFWFKQLLFSSLHTTPTSVVIGKQAQAKSLQERKKVCWRISGNYIASRFCQENRMQRVCYHQVNIHILRENSYKAYQIWKIHDMCPFSFVNPSIWWRVRKKERAALRRFGRRRWEGLIVHINFTTEIAHLFFNSL